MSFSLQTTLSSSMGGHLFIVQAEDEDGKSMEALQHKLTLPTDDAHETDN